MSRHSGFSRSWSNLFGHAAQQQSQATNENALESAQQQNIGGVLPRLHKNKSDSELTTRKRFSLRSRKSNESVNETIRSDEIVNRRRDGDGYLNDLCDMFGNSKDEVESMVQRANQTDDSQSNFLPEDEDSCYRAANEEIKSRISGESDCLSVASSAFVDYPELEEIPDLAPKSSSPLRVREKISYLINKKKTKKQLSPAPPLESKLENLCLKEDVTEEAPDITVEDTPTPIPHPVVKKKSSLKISNMLHSYDRYEQDILEANPNLKGFQLFPSRAFKKGEVSSPNEPLGFLWNVWKRVENGLTLFGELTYWGEADQLIDQFHELVEIPHVNVHILRQSLTPSRHCMQFFKAGSLEIRVPFKDERRFAAWDIMCRIILSDVLYSRENIHEPVVGISWESFKRASVITLWLTRTHIYSNVALNLSRICYFIADLLPPDLRTIMDEENLMYCINESQRFRPIEFYDPSM